MCRHSSLRRQIVCYTEPSGKSSVETVWKRAGTFKKYLAGLSLANFNKSDQWTMAKTLFSAVLFSSFNEEIISILDITDAIAASRLTSLGAAIVVFEWAVASRCCYILTTPQNHVAASSSSDWSEPLWFSQKHMTWILARPTTREKRNVNSRDRDGLTRLPPFTPINEAWLACMLCILLSWGTILLGGRMMICFQ